MDENLKIVRKATDDSLIFVFAVVFAATIFVFFPFMSPAGIALSGAFAATLLTMARRNFFSFAFWTVATVAGAIGYFAWLWPLLVAR